MIRSLMFLFFFFLLWSCNPSAHDYIPVGVLPDLEHQTKTNIETYVKAIKNKPDDDKLYYYLAKSYRFMNHTEGAYDAIKKALKLNPENRLYIILFVQCLYDKKLYYEALDYLEKIDIDPVNDLDIYSKSLDIYHKTGQIKKAIRLLEKDMYHASKPNSVAQKAYFYGLLGDTLSAVRLYDQAIGADSTLISAKLGLAELVFKKGDFTNFKILLQEVLAADSSNLQAAMYLSDHFVQQNQFDSALVYQKKLYQADSANFENILQLGVNYYAQKMFDRAFEYLQKAYLTNSFQFNKYYETGFSAYKIKKWEEALQFFEKVDSTQNNNYIFAQNFIQDIKRRISTREGRN